MKMHKPLTALAVTTALGLLATGCGGAGGANAKANTSQAGGGAFAVDTAKCPADATKALADGDAIKIGTVMPLSGPYAVVGTPIRQGIEIAFAKVNDKGGVAGHKVELVAKDDTYDPTKTLPQVTELLQRDKVFATVGQVGTPNVAAAQPLAEQTCTPQVWAGSGAPQFGDPENHQWTTSGFMSNTTEGQAWADYIKKEKPGAKVAYLELDSDSGAAMAEGFKSAAADAGLTIVASEKTAPTAASVENEITTLLAAKPDVVVVMSFVTSCGKAIGALAQGGYKGMTIAAYACGGQPLLAALGPAANGVAAMAIDKDPAAKANESDPAVTEFKADVAKYGDGSARADDDTMTGYRLGDIMVKNLEAAAMMTGGLTRANVMNAAWNLEDVWFDAYGGFAKLDGVKDAYALESGAMLRYDAAANQMVETGSTIDREAKTGAYQGS